MCRVDVAEHSPSANGGELLVVADEANRGAAFENEADRGVQGEGVGHASLINQHQRAGPNVAGDLVFRTALDRMNEFGQRVGGRARLIPQRCGCRC